jgi:hypothetical protein
MPSAGAKSHTAKVALGWLLNPRGHRSTPARLFILDYRGETRMNRSNLLSLCTTTAVTLVWLASGVIAQQSGQTMHKYLSRAVLTPEGIKNLQEQPPTALKAGIAKFTESVGGSSSPGISTSPRPPDGQSSTIQTMPPRLPRK